MSSIEPSPDPRWKNIIGGFDRNGSPLPMTFELLQEVSRDWESLVSESTPSGVRNLLATSRSLFTYSWFCYEFMVVGCLIAFQALEAVFRQVLYPDVSEKTRFKRLVAMAKKGGIIDQATADLVSTGADLRNSFSHPLDQVVFTVGMAGDMIEKTHHLIRQLVVAGASKSRVPDAGDSSELLGNID